jgi:thiamine biosynthesis lipoprotein
MTNTTLEPSHALLRSTFRAMNSDIELMAADSSAPRHLALAHRWLRAYEERFSRFKPLSELSRLNASIAPFQASRALYRLVELALALSVRSGGLFDPTVLPLLDAAGYDHSFELIEKRQSHHSPARRRFTWRDVSLDPQSRTITMPAECRIDLGGIGKGWAVDRLATILGDRYLVNGGGDIYAGAGPEPGEPWRIGIADPFAPDRDITVLAVERRGVATSSTLRRRWLADGFWEHHLIDPRTGKPSGSDAVQVTVIAQTATEADYHAKVALLLGVEAGLQHLNREPVVEGLIFRSDGAPFETNHLGDLIERKPT